MRKLQLYLDTSVLSHLFHDDTPERKAATVEFFELAVSQKIHDIYISDVVIDEINRTQDENRRHSMLGAIARFQIPLLGYDKDDPDLIRLTQLYIERGIIPPKKLDDALHVAIATIHEIDLLVTWNYRHLANISQETKIVGVNISMGYFKPIRLVTPLEVSIP